MPDHVVPRRRDRSKEETWIRAYLERAPWGTLALAREGGAPHLNSNLFVYRPDPDRIYLHSARTGALPAALEGPEGVPGAFSVSEMGRLLPAPEALEFSIEYNGVVAMGPVRTVRDPAEAESALQDLLDKYAPHLRPGADYRPITAGEMERTAVYRMDIHGWSGKEKSVGEHPGSFGLGRVDVPFVRGPSGGPGKS